MDVEDPDLALTGEVLEGVRLYFFGGVLLVASAASPVLIKARTRHRAPKTPLVWPVDKDDKRAAPLRPYLYSGSQGRNLADFADFPNYELFSMPGTSS